MEFKILSKKLKENFDELVKDVDVLYVTNTDKDKIWDVYMDSFPEGTNEIFRERREYDCSACKQFIRAFGNIVVIKDHKVISIWDMNTESDKYQPVFNALDKYVLSKEIKDVYVSDLTKIGTKENLEQLEEEILKWSHFYVEIPKRLLYKKDNKFNLRNKSEEAIMSEFKSDKDVLKRGLEEITKDSVESVLELIAQNSLYKGNEWDKQLKEYNKLQKEYQELNENQKDIYAWKKSFVNSSVLNKLRNTSIGTLLVNISEGMPLDEAVSEYEKIVAPENYKRSKPVFTKRMLEEAKKTVDELGYTNSLERRFARLDDITVNNIIFSNKDLAKNIKGDLGVFDELKEDIAVEAKHYSKVEEVTIEDFVEKIAPTAREIEILLENKHRANFVSLITAIKTDAKSMFKWDNPFSWSYAGNITDSSIRDNVKNAGGNIEGILRCSLQWNDGEEYNGNDFDLHVIEPSGNHIYYGNSKNHKTTGELDVDIIHPKKDKPAVENIVWTSLDKMDIGDYQFFIKNFSHNGGRTGFKAEIEVNGQIHQFNYDKELRNKEDVQVATITLDKNGEFTVKHKLPSSVSTQEIWGLKTNQFIPVSVMMFSPNYFDDQKGIGNKHYMFMLKDCINEQQPNGFFNEFLNQELYNHRKVMEALGSRMRVENSDDQLSGLGFSSTKRNKVIVKVKGATERILKVKI